MEEFLQELAASFSSIDFSWTSRAYEHCMIGAMQALALMPL